MNWRSTDLLRPFPVVAALLLGSAILAAGNLSAQESDRSSSEPVYLLVSVSERALSVRRGDEILHRFPVGVGTGVRLEGAANGGWTFDTPTGVFEIGRMKEDPVWYVPDWHYVERGLPIPPPYSEERYRRGMLGHYALYLSDEIAIHGTDNESSVGRASSHGCLRMRNADIALVFPLVQVGTKVIIVP